MLNNKEELKNYTMFIRNKGINGYNISFKEIQQLLKLEKEFNKQMTAKQTVTQEQVDKILDTAETQKATFWNKEVVVSYKLYNGFTILGRGACVDSDHFDVELGRKYARQDAVNQLWKLEAYLLQYNLYTNACVCSNN